MAECFGQIEQGFGLARVDEQRGPSRLPFNRALASHPRQEGDSEVKNRLRMLPCSLFDGLYGDFVGIIGTAGKDALLAQEPEVEILGIERSELLAVLP